MTNDEQLMTQRPGMQVEMPALSGPKPLYRDSKDSSLRSE